MPPGQPIERPLDAQRHLLESVEREAGERLARGPPGLRVLAPEDVDEQIDDARAFELAEELRETSEAKRRFVLVFEGQRVAARLLEGRDHPCRVLLDQLVVRVARRALRVIESPESGNRIESWH